MAVPIYHKASWTWADHLLSRLLLRARRLFTYPKIVALHFLLTLMGVPHRISLGKAPNKRWPKEPHCNG